MDRLRGGSLGAGELPTEEGRRGHQRRRPCQASGNGEAASPDRLVQDKDSSLARGPPCVIDWSHRLDPP